MKTNKQTGEQYCDTRQELAEKYFSTFGSGIGSIYAKGNMGIVTLLSDLQEEVAMSNIGSKEHYRQILNDIKCVLIADQEKAEDAEDKGNDRLTYLYEEQKRLKQLIWNRNHLCGEYDKDAEYEVALAEVEQEIAEKEGKDGE